MKIMTCFLATFLTMGSFAGTQPNFLIILADDCTYSDLPLYGGQNAKTPNIDRLATEGLVFNRAYLSEAMCQPCRSALYSGRYPMSNGSAWNHSGSRPGLKTLPHYLQALGYRTGIAGKVHVKPPSCYPFEMVDGFDRKCVRNPTQPHSVKPITEFMTRENTPFCLVVALVEPHVPWVMGDASKYPPKKLKLPPYMVDTPLTRQAFSKYLAEITYMDSQVGDILQVLEKTGKAKDTMVLFSSEQGAQMPGCKWTNWDSGLHTALIVRWPGKVKAGERTDALVQYVDVVPTLIELAGGDPVQPGLDGTSFAAVLRDPSRAHRKYVYGIHNNIPEGPPYPIRTVFNGEFRYIRNLTPDEIYIEKHLMGTKGTGLLNNPYWSTWVYKAGETKRAERLVKRYMKRPAEQLYHTAVDKFELENLAGNPEYAKIKAELSAELDHWMKAEGDPGIPLDTTEAYNAARKGKHIY